MNINKANHQGQFSVENINFLIQNFFKLILVKKLNLYSDKILT